MNELYEKKINNMIKNGCELLKDENRSIVIKCSNSLIMKSPNIKWSVLIPSSELDSTKKLLINENFNPQSMEIGEIAKRGTLGKVNDFIVTDELKINNNQETLKTAQREDIQKNLQNIEKIQYLSKNTDTSKIDYYNIFEKEIINLKNNYNDYTTEYISNKTKQPILCESESIIYNNFNSLLQNQEMLYKIHTYCSVPNLKTNIINKLNKNLKDGFYAEGDIRYLQSKKTNDDNFILDGITLYQKGSPSPFLKFTITDDKILNSIEFKNIIKTLEKQFDKNNIPSKIDENIFLKYI